MPTIKGSITSATNDALANENLRKIPSPGAAVTLCAVGEGATDRLRLLIGQTEIMPAAQPNLVTDADTGPNVQSDILVSNEIVGPGDLILACPAVTAQVQFQLNLTYL